MKKSFLTILMAMAISLSASNELNFFASLFTEPIERIYIIMKDKTIFRATNNDEKRIYIGFGILERELKKHGFKIEDIEIVIHNHFADHKFSDADQKQNRALKKRGFNGLFLLYCHRTNKIYNIEDEEKSN